VLEPGTEIAGYRVEAILGQGGMGIVYEATQVALGRRVALKLLAPELGSDPTFLERFRNEGRAQAALDHPNIVTVFEAGETDGRLFLAMRLIRGSTLRQLISDRGSEASRVLRILGPIADALDTAHAAGLIHRDIKPQNILVGGRDHPYLADFGITKSAGDIGLTRTGRFVGTTDYIAPEEIRGEHETRATDIYAFAAVLYECLTGEVPYRRPSSAALLFAHLHDPPPAVTDRRPDLPDALDDVIARGMAKDPADRHPSAAALILDAGRALGRHVDVAQPAHEPPAEAASPTPRMRDGASERRYTPTTPGLVSAELTAPPPAIPRPSAPTSADTPVPRERRAAPRRGLVNVMAAAGLVVLITGAVGFVIGQSGSGGPDLSKTADAGTLALTVPAGWDRVATDGKRLGLRRGYTTASGDRSSAVTLGESDASGKILLPVELRRGGAGKGAAAGRAVRLGRLLAIRYRDVEVPALGRDRRAIVYAVPTSEGVATIVCAGRRSDFPSLADTCDRMAETAQLKRGRPSPLAPTSAYAKSVDSALDALRRSRARGAKQLRSAKTFVGQAKAATALAAAYRRAAVTLKRIPPGAQERSAHERLARGAGDAAEAYRLLATAAQRVDRPSYRRARRNVAAAEDDQRVAVQALRDLGYRID
jgi:tRNA A-37 threonylcarbamoyl transferase component Bud32